MPCAVGLSVLSYQILDLFFARELVDNGAIIEFPDDCMKQVVEGCDKEPFRAIADDIQGAMSGMVVSNKYQIEIKITAL